MGVFVVRWVWEVVWVDVGSLVVVGRLESNTDWSPTLTGGVALCTVLLLTQPGVEHHDVAVIVCNL